MKHHYDAERNAAKHGRDNMSREKEIEEIAGLIEVCFIEDDEKAKGLARSLVDDGIRSKEGFQIMIKTKKCEKCETLSQSLLIEPRNYKEEK